MRSEHKRKLFFATATIGFFSTLFALLVGVVSHRSLDTALMIIVLIIGFIIMIAVTYMVVYMLLSPASKANTMLELLLKDTLHELNIPLSTITANVQMLRSGLGDSRKLKRLDRIGLACNDLQRLYKDMDYYIKREVRYDLKEVFDLKELIQVQILQFESRNNPIILDLHTCMVECDKHGLVKVINNLVSNAIKYSDEEKNIHIFLKDGTLKIVDQGKGISETELFCIFDRYYQADTSKEGHGIGLSIVKRYCDENKIDIKIRSRVSEGTSVFLDLKNIMHTY